MSVSYDLHVVRLIFDMGARLDELDDVLAWLDREFVAPDEDCDIAETLTSVMRQIREALAAVRAGAAR